MQCQNATPDEPPLSMDGSQLRLLRRAVELMEEELVALVAVVQKLGKDKAGESCWRRADLSNSRVSDALRPH